MSRASCASEATCREPFSGNADHHFAGLCQIATRGGREGARPRFVRRRSGANRAKTNPAGPARLSDSKVNGVSPLVERLDKSRPRGALLAPIGELFKSTSFERAIRGFTLRRSMAVVRRLSNPSGPLKVLIDQTRWGAKDAAGLISAAGPSRPGDGAQLSRPAGSWRRSDGCSEPRGVDVGQGGAYGC